jgi:hypothetical protein
LNVQSNRFFFGGLAALVALGFVLQSIGTLNPDVSWINYGVTRLLSGAKLYVDIVEVNPPTIYYLSMPPIWLATVTGYDSSPLYVLWVLLVAALSASIGHFTFNDKRPQTLALCLAYACLVTVLIGEAFGQREHLMIMLLSPYIFLKIAKQEKPESRPALAALIGVLAAIAIALKPHYVLVIIALEAMELFRRRRLSFSAETIAGLLMALVLLAGLLVFHPEFLNTIIMLGAKAYLPFYRESTTTILSMFGLTAFFLTTWRLSGPRHSPPHSFGSECYGNAFAISRVSLPNTPRSLFSPYEFCLLDFCAQARQSDMDRFSGHHSFNVSNAP